MLLIIEALVQIQVSTLQKPLLKGERSVTTIFSKRNMAKLIERHLQLHLKADCQKGEEPEKPVRKNKTLTF